jgi:hypothetical protein
MEQAHRDGSLRSIDHEGLGEEVNETRPRHRAGTPGGLPLVDLHAAGGDEDNEGRGRVADRREGP